MPLNTNINKNKGNMMKRFETNDQSFNHQTLIIKQSLQSFSQAVKRVTFFIFYFISTPEILSIQISTPELMT